MLSRFIVGTSLTLLTSLSLQAQSTDPARFATERDSLFQRAAVIRSQKDAQISFFKTSFVATGGTRLCTKGYVTTPSPTTASFQPDKLPRLLLKKHIVKHKSVGTVVEKVFYYTVGGNVALAEYYQDGQLVRLQAFDYYEVDPKAQATVIKLESGNYATVTSNVSGRNPLKEVKFLRGDYLVKTTRKGVLKQAGKTTEYFVAPQAR
ncbi:hypothetical protein [Hymenobacter lucidus]|uniref:Uncharacterized protein n=1 Tax=Hymenobacter lucidus TaxID=2880930 RepID=A0ABS8AX73_9BACT|nr:hypothetical protein [Hymenobacter lucidus]MCB2410411.1 hypothetical protein [Hymenobacter lucidus]